MVKLTVILLRHGESESECLNDEEAKRASEIELATQRGDAPPSPFKKKKLVLWERLDPQLSYTGFTQARSAAKALLGALTEETEARKMALFAAPLRSCTATALMISSGGVSVLSEKGKLKWGLTTMTTNSPPAAIPCVIQNGLCNGAPEIKKLGGDQAVIAAGLLHCAAEKYNNSKLKCPIMGVFKTFKAKAQDQTKLWLDGLENFEDSDSESEDDSDSDSDSSDDSDSDDDEDERLEKQQKKQAKEARAERRNGKEERQRARKEKFKRVLDGSKKVAREELRRVDLTQFLRVSDPTDPYSLEIMTPKVSLVIDYWEPDSTRSPPRNGSFDPKNQDKKWKKGALLAIQQSVWMARQTGCDTVILVVPHEAMEQLAQKAGKIGTLDTYSCSVMSLVADIDDEKEGKAIKWELHGSCSLHTLQQDPMDVIPDFTGPVDVLVKPPEGQDPQSIAGTRWAAFPVPEEEYLPPNYPDLPDFSMALEVEPPVIGSTVLGSILA
jgi:hypothetical protein